MPNVYSCQINESFINFSFYFNEKYIDNTNTNSKCSNFNNNTKHYYCNFKYCSYFNHKNSPNFSRNSISNIVIISTTRILPILVGIQLTSVSKIPSSLVVMGITLVFTILGIASFVPPWYSPSIEFCPPKGIFIFHFHFMPHEFFHDNVTPMKYIVERPMTFVTI